MFVLMALHDERRNKCKTLTVLPPEELDHLLDKGKLLEDYELIQDNLDLSFLTSIIVGGCSTFAIDYGNEEFLVIHLSVENSIPHVYIYSSNTRL